MKKIHQNWQASYKMIKKMSAFYRLVSATCNKFQKYKDNVSSTDSNDLETFGTRSRDCICRESPFMNNHHGRIVSDIRFT